MINGLLSLPWWGYVVVTLLLTHITIASVTLYLHRCQTHRSVTLHPVISHFFRFWLWLTTGQVTKQWVAIHRKHHANVETEDDPHSPRVRGIRKVLLEGTELYRAEAANAETLEKYGSGTPDDWLERHVYTRHNTLGVPLMLLIDVALFGLWGVTIWAIQMLWIPVFAAGIINGAGHYWGYRNYQTADGSTNITNFGILIGGEEMHNNHHAYPSSARFSAHWWELDLGWWYIRMLSALGLARVKKVAPRPVIVPGKEKIDMDTLRAVIAGRLHVMRHYARSVSLPVLRQELDKAADASYRRTLKQAKRVLMRGDESLDDHTRLKLDRALNQSETLTIVYEFRRRLQEIWSRTYASHEKLLHALQEWCRQAEATGIMALQEFAQRLRGYSLQPA